MRDATLAAELRRIPLFARLSDEQLESLMQGAELWLGPGERIAAEGEPPKGFYVQLAGRTEWTTTVGGQEVHYTFHEPGDFYGHELLLTGKPHPVTGRALTGVRLYKLEPEAFWGMLFVCPQILRGLVSTLAERWQNLGDVSQQTAKLASLGTMAAGLAHELNNPASAARRAADGLGETLGELRSLGLGLGEHRLSAGQRDLLASVLDGAAGRAGPSNLDALERSDREDDLADRLDALGVKNAWDLAPTFVEAGLDEGRLREIAERLGPAAPVALAWLGATLAAEGSAGEVEKTTAQISELVGAMKEYSFMDQVPLQEVDVHRGLESTLAILGYKLKRGVEVTREYDPKLPRVWAHGSELNQVWTNLIDNAADAMEGRGRLMVRTRRENDRVLVEIADDGPGVPEDVRGRVFEPFFTTKGVGEGTGLGLDIVRRVVEQHGGDVRVLSEPGDTRFQVRLPLDRGLTDKRDSGQRAARSRAGGLAS